MKKIYALFIITLVLFQWAKAQEPVDFDEWKLKCSDGVRLYVTEFGKGDTIIVIHGGWGAEHSYLLDAFVPLASSFHFVLYDQRGSLRSSCADSLISVKRHVEDLEELRIALGAKKLMLAGHSMGGFLALLYTNTYPGNVKKLFLMGSAPATGTITDFTTKITEPTLKRWDREDVKAEFRKNGLDTFQKKAYTFQQAWLWHRISFAAINLHDISKWKQIKGSLYYNEHAGMAAASTSPEEWDFTAVLDSIKISVQVVHGTDDYLPIEYHKNWVPKVANAKLVEIKDAGHCLWIDQPKAFAKEFRNFFGK